MALQLSGNLRRSDGVFRYGGAVFCVLMTGTTPDAARAAADKLRQILSKHGYIDGAARFTFSTGVAVYEPGEDADSDVLGEPGELLRRADQALNVAKLAGGARTVVWTPDGTDSGVGTLDRLPDGSIEDPELAAPRELSEETGYRAGAWRKPGRFWKLLRRAHCF